jgi:co-chaperonin GroES (HSP10)
MAAKLGIFRASILGASLLLSIAATAPYRAMAQAPAAAAPKIGTVKTISGSSITLTTDAGQQVSVTVADGARILQLAPGSKDLKSAQTITLGDIAVGDRILVAGKAGDDAASFTASRVILMKAQDIAQQHAKEQEDWQKRGTGGLVSAVDEATGTLTVSIGAKKVEVHTSPSTKFRRYAGASVKFEDAQPGTLAQVRAGDQLRVLGTKSDDGASIQAEIVVSGSFLHLAGTIASIDAANGTLTLKDLATKRTMTVKLTSDSDVRKLPPQIATRFAARAKGGDAAHGAEGASAHAGQANASAASTPQNGEQRGRSAGLDLSQMLSRLPTETIADLKVGDAIMVVASQDDSGSSNVSAVTLLSGVEPILAATPKGGAAMSLSPWNVGGGDSPDAGGGPQ